MLSMSAQYFRTLTWREAPLLAHARQCLRVVESSQSIWRTPSRGYPNVGRYPGQRFCAGSATLKQAVATSVLSTVRRRGRRGCLPAKSRLQRIDTDIPRRKGDGRQILKVRFPDIYPQQFVRALFGVLLPRVRPVIQGPCQAVTLQRSFMRKHLLITINVNGVCLT